VVDAISESLFECARFSTDREILFVRKDKEQCVSQFILVQHALQFLTSLDNTIAVIAVNDENDALGVLEVMSPKRSDLVLTTDIPDGELDVLVVNSFDVEAYTDSLFSTVQMFEHEGYRQRTDCGNRCDNFAQLQLVQNCRFTGSIETDHQNAHLFPTP